MPIFTCCYQPSPLPALSPHRHDALNYSSLEHVLSLWYDLCLTTLSAQTTIKRSKLRLLSNLLQLFLHPQHCLHLSSRPLGARLPHASSTRLSIVCIFLQASGPPGYVFPSPFLFTVKSSLLFQLVFWWRRHWHRHWHTALQRSSDLMGQPTSWPY